MEVSRNANKENVMTTPPEVRSIISSDSVAHKETVWRQYLAAFLASVISLSTGCVGGWSSPATPKLMDGTSGLGIRPLSVDEASWVGSLINLGAVFGAIPAGYLSFRYGRRTCLLLLAWPIIVGWLFIIFNQNKVWFLYIGRFISGISYGSMNIALPIYNNEICCDRIRGRVGTMYDLLQCVGLLYVYFFGALTSIFWTTWISLLVPIVFFLSFYWMPESPLYYTRHGEKDNAVKSIKWLYGKHCNIREKLEHIHRALLEGKEETNRDENQERSSFLSPISQIKNFYNSLSKVTVKAFLLAFFLFVVQRTCGATMVQYYGDSIFEMTKSSIQPNYATVLVGILSVVGSAISIVAVDTIGRRFLLTFSFFIMSLSMVVFVAYVQLIVINEDPFLLSLPLKDVYGLVPAVTLCLFLAMFRLGVSPVPWFMTPEIIPTEAQKWAPSVIVCFTWGSSFLMSKCFLPAVQALGQVTVYSFFLALCIIGFLYTLKFIPETKNKSREQIQSELGASIPYDEL